MLGIPDARGHFLADHRVDLLSSQVSSIFEVVGDAAVWIFGEQSGPARLPFTRRCKGRCGCEVLDHLPA
jgi:hypothetical protein